MELTVPTEDTEFMKLEQAANVLTFAIMNRLTQESDARVVMASLYDVLRRCLAATKEQDPEFAESVWREMEEGCALIIPKKLLLAL